jgi:2-polyprenyl-3-methyl-5-hydroxy-6-metoxy-1,4-benzoquinol methylase
MKTIPCPICNGLESLPFLSVQDHTVSGEKFNLVNCKSCSFLFTANPPAADKIGNYYQSDAYISHTDSHEGMFNKIYQFIRNITLVSKRKLVEQYSGIRKGNLLDYGCGTGAFLKEMKISGWNTIGLEPDPGARQRAKELSGSQVDDPTTLAKMSGDKFDAITLWHVLEHVHELDVVLSMFHQILNEKGVLLIAVPNHKSYDAKHYGAHWAAYDVPRHLYHFSPDTISQLLLKYGFNKIGIKPMWFDAFYVSMLSEKYRNGKMKIAPAILTGLISNLQAFFKPGTCSSQIYIFSKK